MGGGKDIIDTRGGGSVILYATISNSRGTTGNDDS